MGFMLINCSVSRLSLSTDGDSFGDACDLTCPRDATNDVDGDGVCGGCDNAPATPNPLQEDIDHDAVGDVIDNCPTVYNPSQIDSNENGTGDACEISA